MSHSVNQRENTIGMVCGCTFFLLWIALAAFYMNPHVLISLPIAALFAFIGAAIGEPRKRFGMGFFYGALFGPVGWMIILIGPSYATRCPHCLTAIHEAASVCHRCGLSVSS